jgi:hypothetical protein
MGKIVCESMPTALHTSIIIAAANVMSLIDTLVVDVCCTSLLHDGGIAGADNSPVQEFVAKR